MRAIDNDPWKFTWSNYVNRSWRDKKLTKREASLLFILTLHSHRVVNYNEITEFFWPDPNKEAENPKNTIRVYVSRLRKKYHKELIIAKYGCELYLVRPITKGKYYEKRQNIQEQPNARWPLYIRHRGIQL